MKKLFFLSLFFILANQFLAQEIQFPFAKKVESVDTFFTKYVVKDEYRWLENTDSAEVKKWRNDEQNISDKCLTKASNSYSSEISIEKYAHTEYNSPVKKGNYYFKKMVYNQFASPSLYLQWSLNDEEKLLIDPNFISKKDKIIIENYDVSKNSELLAYEYSRNGSDWAEAKVISLKNGLDAYDDHLVNLKFSNLAWKDKGFFYCTFPQTDKFGKTEGQKVFYHKIGDDQSKDSLVFSRKNPEIQFDFLTTSDERFFVLTEYCQETDLRSIFYIDYNEKQPVLKPLLTNLKYDLEILDNYGDEFIARTTYRANNGSIIKINIATPYKWKTIVLEYSKALLLDVIPLKDRIIAIYQSNYHPIMVVVNYNGDELYKMAFPVGTSVGGFSGKPDDEELLFTYSSYTIPPVVYRFNVKTFKKQLTRSTKVNFDFDKIEYKELEYTAKDGTKIPMILVYKQGIKKDGSNPTILNAYGGFGIVEQASFDPGIVYFIEEGGIYAFANIRGGGDFGKSWADAGRGLNKQTSFDDFISAAEFLIDSGYTNSQKLASTGASNGGLVVAATAIQRPDLFKVAVPVVAPLDMLRFEKFTVGHWHIDEYGTTKDSLSFSKLLSYSPLHNIKEDINYPAMLIMTSENDDRVPPLHSYKFVARLQNRTAQTNPILLRIEKNAGHYGATYWNSWIKEEGDKFGFIMKMLNSKE